MSTPITLPDVYKELPHKFPGLDVAQSSTGVIWTTERAAEQGFTYDDPSKYNSAACTFIESLCLTLGSAV